MLGFNIFICMDNGCLNWLKMVKIILNEVFISYNVLVVCDKFFWVLLDIS